MNQANTIIESATPPLVISPGREAIDWVLSKRGGISAPAGCHLFFWSASEHLHVAIPDTIGRSKHSMMGS